MRDRLIYILKHNKLIQKLYVVIMSFVFKVWGAFLKTDDKLVLFVSFMGKNFNDSPKVLYQRPASRVYFFAFFNLRNLLYLIKTPLGEWMYFPTDEED